MLLLKIPTALLHEILAEWLEIQDVVSFDSAACSSKSRSLYLQTVQDASFAVTTTLGEMSSSLLKWLQRRKIRASQLSFDDFSALLTFSSVLSAHPFRHLTHLHISGPQSLLESDIRTIVAELSLCKHLVHFALHNGTSLPNLTAWISAIPAHLTHLDLHNFHDYLNSDLSSCRLQLQHLQTLDLSRANFDNEGTWLTENCPNLHSILLNRSFGIQDDFVIHIARHYRNQLQRLELNDCDSLGDRSLRAVLEFCTGLEHLELNGKNRMTREALVLLSSSDCNFKTLNISKHYSLTIDDILAIVQNAPNLFALFLSFNSCVHDRVLIFIAENCNDLEVCALQYCYKITDAGLLSLVRGCGRLRSLDLTHCERITDLSLQSLVLATAHQLECLNLTMCVAVTDTTVILIAELCQCLRSLQLNGCIALTDACLWALAVGNTRLSLREMAITDNHLITDLPIYRLVQSCLRLHSLDVSNCSTLTDDVVTSLRADFSYRLSLIATRYRIYDI